MLIMTFEKKPLFWKLDKSTLILGKKALIVGIYKLNFSSEMLF